MKRSVVAAALLGLLALLLGSPSRAEGERVVRLVATAEPPQLNSAKATDAESFVVLSHITEGLTRLGKKGEIVPGIAERWEIRDDGATFYLRRGALWADGKPVTAHDFMFAWRTAVDPKTASEYAFIVYPIKNGEAINQGKLPPSALGVSAPDDWTLEVQFEKPCGYFLGLTAFSTYRPIREDVYEKFGARYAADADKLVGNGPFNLTEWTHGASLTMVKNPLFWAADRIQLDRIEVPYITTDGNTVYNLFLDGKIDMIRQFGSTQLPRAMADRLNLKLFDEGSVWYLGFNHRPGRPTSNYHLRKALQLAFDPKPFVSRVVAIPGSRPGISPIASWVPGVSRRFRAEHPMEPIRVDVEAAQRHLEQAREELGGSLPALTLLAGDTPASGRFAEYFQNLYAERLGLKIRIDLQIFKQRLAKMTAGDYDFVFAGWSPDFADAMTYADLFASWNLNNRGRYNNPRYDALIRKAQGTSEPRTRMDAMAAAERLLIEDAGIIMLYERVKLYSVHPRVSGLVRHVVGADTDLAWASVE